MARKLLGVFLIGLVAAFTGACGSSVISSAVQPGSTVALAIPFGGKSGVNEYGFGGSLVADDDGEMVVVLSREMSGVTETVELDTLMSFAAEPPVESNLANATNWFGRQLVIAAEVPAGTLPGSYSVEVLHRALDGTDTPVFTLAEPFTVLPNDIEVTRPDGSTEIVSGTSSQIDLSQWTTSQTGVTGTAGVLSYELPPPTFGVELRVAGTLGAPGPWATYAAVDVSYPAGVIDISAVYAIDPGVAHVWFEDDGVGNLRLYGISLEHVRPDTALKPFRVVYALDDSEVPLDRSSLSATLVVARDAVGAPLTDPITIEITQ